MNYIDVTLSRTYRYKIKDRHNMNEVIRAQKKAWQDLADEVAFLEINSDNFKVESKVHTSN